MKIKRVIKKTNLEATIKCFSEITPLSINLKDVNKKEILSLSSKGKEPLYNYPIIFDNKTVGELNVSENGTTARFLLHIINEEMAKQNQIAQINEEVLLLYDEINLLYDLTSLEDKDMSMKEFIGFLLKKCTNFFSAQNASLWIIGEDSLKCTAFSESKPDVSVFKLEEGFLGHLATFDESEILNCPITDSRWTGEVSATTSVMSILLKVRCRNAGILHISKHNGLTFSARDFKLAKVFAHYISQSMGSLPAFLWHTL